MSEGAHKETRREQVTSPEQPFSPNSLCGSWGLYSGDDVRTEVVLFVGEPQAGVYLAEGYDVVTDEPSGGQRIMLLQDLIGGDVEIGHWRMYDTHEEVLEAFKTVMA